MNIIDEIYRLKNNRFFNRIIIGIFVLIILIITGFIALRYHVEGDTNLPFILSKIIIVSSAEGKNIQTVDSKWSFSLSQNNDFYISIKKNEEYKRSEIIESIKIENIKINKKQSVGDIKSYKPATNGLFKEEEKYLIKDALQYTGSKESNINEYKIGNQGGTILFRSANTNIITYNSNEDEILHNGTLLAKAGITNEQIKYSIEFDIVIETNKSVRYKGTVKMNLPEGDILTDGRTSIEKTDFTDVIFKRI